MAALEHPNRLARWLELGGMRTFLLYVHTSMEMITRFGIFGLALCFLSSAASQAHASPPSWPPSEISYSVAAHCGQDTATVFFTVTPSVREVGTFSIASVSVSRNAAEPSLIEFDAPLPDEVLGIERPFVERVIPICIENERFSFVFYIASEAEIELPNYVNRGDTQKVYLDISEQNILSIYTIPKS